MDSNPPADILPSSIHIHHRYFTQTGPLPGFHARESLSLTLTSLFSRLSSYDLSTIRFHGIFAGPTDIAYFLIRIRRIFQKNDNDDEGSSIYKGFLPEIEKWINILLEDIPRPTTRVVHPSRGGVADEMAAYWTVRAIWEDDVKYADKAVEIAAQAISLENCGSNEWLYGRAGYLYLLRVLRCHFGDSSTSTLSSPSSSSSSSANNNTANKDLLARIDTATLSLINTILSSPRPWQWHGMNGHGAVHGSAGIILQVYLSTLSSCATTSSPKHIRHALSSTSSPSSSSTKRIRDALLPDLNSLLSHQLPSGNWSACSERPADKFVQVCHGAPGIVLTLRKLQAMRFFHNSVPYEELVYQTEYSIEAAVECIVERGMLTKVPSLCHGITGNVLALPKEGREVEVGRFMGCMTEGVVEMGRRGSVEERGQEEEGGWFSEGEDDAMSLWTGPAGRVWCWVMYLTEGRWGDLIGYSDV